MGEWNTKRLGELLAYQKKGITPSYAPAGANTVRVFNQKCNRDFALNPALARYNDISSKAVAPDLMLRKGDVVINSTGTGTLGRVAQYWDVDGQSTVDSHMLLMRATDELNPLFFGYALKLYQEKLMNMGIGSSGQEELDRLALNKIAITYPVSKQAQYDIAQTLAAFDEKIALNQRLIKELEEQARMVYDYWFLQNDFPDENGKPYRSSGGKMVWSNEMNREIPSGWRVYCIQEIISACHKGITPAYCDESSVMVLNQKCVRGGRVQFIEARYHDQGLKKSGIEAKCLQNFDTLVNSTGMGALGRVGWFIYDGDKEVVTDSHILCLRANRKYCLPAMLYMTVYKCEESLMRAASGSTGQAELDKEVLMKNIKIALPSPEEQREANDLICGLRERAARMASENILLAAQRDFLLPRLMTGEITVAE